MATYNLLPVSPTILGNPNKPYGILFAWELMGLGALAIADAIYTPVIEVNNIYDGSGNKINIIPTRGIFGKHTPGSAADEIGIFSCVGADIQGFEMPEWATNGGANTQSTSAAARAMLPFRINNYAYKGYIVLAGVPTGSPAYLTLGFYNDFNAQMDVI